MARERPERVKRRLTCTFTAEGQAYRGVVLDVSERGLFVQTGAALAPGTPVELELAPLTGDEHVRARARVARRKRVPPQLASVVRHGLGLELLEPCPALVALVSGQARPAAPSPPAGARPRTPVAGATAAAPGQAYRVRVRERGGARSRWLEIRAESEREARHRAEREVGAAWDVVEAQPA